MNAILISYKVLKIYYQNDTALLPRVLRLLGLINQPSILLEGRIVRFLRTHGNSWRSGAEAASQEDGKCLVAAYRGGRLDVGVGDVPGHGAARRLPSSRLRAFSSDLAAGQTAVAIEWSSGEALVCDNQANLRTAK
jgi:hypothetical protein